MTERDHNLRNPMVAMVATGRDALLHGQTCVNCHEGFVDGDHLFISGDYRTALHRVCMEGLLAGRFDDVDYEALRDRILTSGTVRFDE
jgi:hypothetical protein